MTATQTDTGRSAPTWERLDDQIINLTAHPVRLVAADGTTVLGEWPAAELPARVRMEYIPSGTVGSVPLHREMPEGVRNLPEEVSGTYLIVSRVVAAAALMAQPERNDLLVPGQPKHDGNRVVGTRQLVRV